MQVKLKEIPAMMLLSYISECQNVWLWGEPAIGKTDTIMEFVRKMRERIENFKVWYFYGPTMSPIDIQATLMSSESDVMKICNNETLPNAYTDPDAQGVLFLGEAGNTDPTTLKQLQKYINGEDMNGKLRKPNGVMVVADSNRLNDRSGTMQQFRALMSRFQQISVYTDAEDNIEFAKAKSWHPYVQLFFKNHPLLINNYADVFEGGKITGLLKSNEDRSTASEEGKCGVWANMRAWRRIHLLETGAMTLGVDVPLALIIGNVGTGVGRQYAADRAVSMRLQSVDDICRDPKNAVVPEKIDELFGQCLVLALRCTLKQIGPIHIYGQRLPLDMQVLILRRMAMRENFPLDTSPAYIKWMSNPALTDLLMAK